MGRAIGQRLAASASGGAEEGGGVLGGGGFGEFCGGFFGGVGVVGLFQFVFERGEGEQVFFAEGVCLRFEGRAEFVQLGVERFLEGGEFFDLGESVCGETAALFFEAVAFGADGEGAGGVAFGDEVGVEFLERVFVGSGEPAGFCGEFRSWAFLPEPLELEAECGEAAGDGVGWGGGFFGGFLRWFIGRFILGSVLGFVFGGIGWIVLGFFRGFVFWFIGRFVLGRFFRFVLGFIGWFWVGGRVGAAWRRAVIGVWGRGGGWLLPLSGEHPCGEADEDCGGGDEEIAEGGVGEAGGFGAARGRGCGRGGRWGVGGGGGTCGDGSWGGGELARWGDGWWRGRLADGGEGSGGFWRGGFGRRGFWGCGLGGSGRGFAGSGGRFALGEGDFAGGGALGRGRGWGVDPVEDFAGDLADFGDRLVAEIGIDLHAAGDDFVDARVEFEGGGGEFEFAGGGGSGEHLVEDDAEGVDVGAVVRGGVAVVEFWGGVFRGSHGGP